MIEAGIFGSQANFDARLISDHDKLAQLVMYWKEMGVRVVLTSGTFDLLHVGHILYLEKARACGDLLVVGVDTDDAVRQRKGPTRPVVPEGERMRMLASIRAVDVITIEKPDGAGWKLCKKIRPNVLVVSHSTGDAKFDEETLRELGEYCDEVKVLPPQAETSTTARLRLLIVDGLKQISPSLKDGLAEEMKTMFDRVVRQVLSGEKK